MKKMVLLFAVLLLAISCKKETALQTEALNNAIKYTEASEIAIDAELVEESIKISIEDNRKGFEWDAIQKGNGLQNIQKTDRRYWR